jgi:hypothetical protein
MRNVLNGVEVAWAAEADGRSRPCRHGRGAEALPEVGPFRSPRERVRYHRHDAEA